MLNLNKLLNREPASINLDNVSKLIQGKKILISGSSGSIGSVLTKQIATFNPSSIILFDRNENAQFFLEKELKEQFSNINIIPRIGSTSDINRARAIFEETRPDCVYHCSASKHIVLCEENVSEAINNNVLATKILANLAIEFGCEIFVLTSTDKVATPKSVLGATKRIAEYLIQLSSKSQNKTKFLSVRFGNVLGSSGSLIPILAEQIKENKPLTLTHKSMTRFFMSISEAASLMLEGSYIGANGDTLILDMGQPISILSIAKNLISQLSDNSNYPIVFTGVRPGEKIHEDLIFKNEELIKTSHPKIFSTQTTLPFDDNELMQKIIGLVNYPADTDPNFLKKCLMELIPEANLKIS